MSDLCVFGEKIWLDGTIVPTASTSIPVMTHALHYGSSAFEGIRVYNGSPFKLDAHIDRLIHSANCIGIKVQYTHEELRVACIAAIEANSIENGYMRPLVWRGQGDSLLIDGATCPIHTMVGAWPAFGSKRSDLRARGMRLTVSEWKKGTAETSPHTAKVSATYMMATLIKNNAALLGFDDAVILDLHNNVTESSTANLFFIAGDQLITPIADCFLNGITRQTIAGEVASRLGLVVVERHISVNELKDFDAAFITGTAIEAIPIASITHEGITYKYDIQNVVFQSILLTFLDITMSAA